MTDKEMKHSAIVAEVLVHFGMGYASARGRSASGKQPSIFYKDALSDFHSKLIASVGNHDHDLKDWGTDNGEDLRTSIVDAAFYHGELAWAEVKPEEPKLTEEQIYATLRKVQSEKCQGGVACDFRV